MKHPPALLIVNADDYGYFPCVNAGIRQASRDGILTATGILVSAGIADAELRALRDDAELDLGVHLNLTHGVPMCRALRRRLGGAAGQFPGKLRLAAMVASGFLGRDLIRDEWRAQIEHCLEAGARLRFLNSHEHVHMLPALFALTQELCAGYGIEHLRFTTPDPGPSRTAGLGPRDAALALAARLNRGRLRRRPPRMLGLGVSGKLSLGYLERTLPGLTGGEVYELMCHPGQCRGAAETSPRLARYHAWRQELAALVHPGTRELLARHHISPIGYRHLDRQSDAEDATAASGPSAPARVGRDGAART